MNIPARRKLRLYERKAFAEAVTVVPPAIAAWVAARSNLADPAKRVFGWWLLAGIIWLIGASILKVIQAHAQDKEQKRKQDYEGLNGALHVIYSALSSRAGLTNRDDGRVRLTIHRVVPSKGHSGAAEQLEQLLPYLGGSGGPPGRTFSIRSGIIGKAAREKAVFAASRVSEDHSKFLSELIRDWNLTEEDARNVQPDRRAWMAVPIFGPRSSVVAVVFLDSNQQHMFDGDMQRLVVDACGGVASYIDEAYS